MNLSAWSLSHSRITVSLIIIILFAGIISYQRVGRLEDPEFTIKTALVVAAWPGATAEEMERQVIEVLEDNIQEMEQVDHIRAEARPGECTIWVDIKETYWSDALSQVWDELRRKVIQAQPDLPQGVLGPMVMDDFGDVFGILLAVTNDGHPHAFYRDTVDRLRRELLLVPEVARVELFGAQDEQIFIESSRSRMASQQLDPDTAIGAIRGQNTIVTGGSIELGSDRINFYPTGTFQSLGDIEQARIPTGMGGSVAVRDLATVVRGLSDTPRSIMRFAPPEAPTAAQCIGLGISIESGGNVIRMGEAVSRRVAELQADLPVGIEIFTYADQARVVNESIAEFTWSVVQAVVIVFLVLLVGLGLRMGVVVGLAIPLTILATLIWMGLIGINLQRASLGALVIVLGMVVDNSIVVSDLIMTKVRQGKTTLAAVGDTFSLAALPLITATVVSSAAFLPVFLSPEASGEFLRSLFLVVSIALGMSWVIAFLVTPMLCHQLLKRQGNGKGSDTLHTDWFHRGYRRSLEWMLHHRVIFLAGIYIAFVLAVYGFGHVKQSFFPDAIRPQFTCDIELPEGSHIHATEDVAADVEQFLLAIDDVEHVATFVGEGVPRFILTHEPPAPNPSFGQLLVTTSSPSANQGVMDALADFIENTHPDVEPRIALVAMGPPTTHSISLRVMGPDPNVLRDISAQVQSLMHDDPRCISVSDDWRRRVPSIILDVDQSRANRAGVTNRDISRSLESIFSGMTIDLFREGTRRIPIVVRASTYEERHSLETLFNTPITSQGRMGLSVPLRQIAMPQIDWMDARIQRRDKRSTIQPRCNVIPEVMPEDVRRDLVDRIEVEIQPSENYPDYILEWGGEYENARDSQQSTTKYMPVALGIMALTLMLKFNSFRRVGIFGLYIPLFMIGVTPGLLITGQPFGFVALLGLMSLAGIMINNGVVLIDQIDQHLAAGMKVYEAIVEAAVLRLRPILLSAGTTVLGMIPLVLSGPFWRPMAIVIMAGLAVGTILTLGVVPALFSLLFKAEQKKRKVLDPAQ